MPYIGNNLQFAFPSYRNIDDISGSFDGVTTSFALTVSGTAPVPLPVSSNQCLISVGGVVQRPDDSGTEGFRLSGGNIIFSSAPAALADFFGVILAGADYANAGANFPSGSASNPSITFESDLDTGLYTPGPNEIGFTNGGTTSLVVGSTGQLRSGTIGSAGTPTYSFNSDPNTGIYSPGADQVAISTNSSERIRIGANGEIGLGGANYGTNGQVLTSAGSGAAPTWQTPTATTDKIEEGNTTAEVIDTGSDGRFVVTTEGTERLRVDSSGRLGIGTTSPAVPLEIYAAGSGIKNVLNIKGAASASGDGGAITFSNLDPTAFQLAKIGAAFEGGSFSGSLRFYTNTNNDGASLPERMRIDSSGRLLVGTSTSRSLGGSERRVQVEGTTAADGAISAVVNDNSSAANAPAIVLGRSRGTALGSNTVVQNGDSLGYIQFAGADGSNSNSRGAWIVCEVDGVPGANDMPGRLVFSTTADGASSPTEAMRINNAGELLVGYTADNGAYKLQVNSQIFATSAIIATSDGRYKENVATLDGCVDLVKALRPVSFDWKEQQDITRVDDDGNEVLIREGHNFPDGTQVGFIAQEVQEVLADKPWLGSVIKQNVRHAVTDNDGNELAPEEEFLGIAEGNLIAVLTSALQEAIGRVEQLEAAVTALQQS